MEVNTSNIPLKELIIRDMARNKNVFNDKIIPEAIMLAVVNHQFESTVRALPLNNSVEISGFGKFVFNEKRGAKQLSQYEALLSKYTDSLNDELAPHERRNLQMRITTTLANIKALKPKIKNDE